MIDPCRTDPAVASHCLRYPNDTVLYADHRWKIERHRLDAPLGFEEREISLILRATITIRLTLILSLFLWLSNSAIAGLVETVREPSIEVRATWNRAGSAVCPSEYDYVARIKRCIARSFSKQLQPAQRTRRGSALCPDGYDYVVRYRSCLSR